ncbi:MAG: hypothetical protein J6U75_02925 [Clostridia bacterium]|nr:hypothetical protein [Clostridia bacterium]
MLRIGFFVSDCVSPVFRDLNFNCELEQKTNMKEIFTDGIADIILSHGLVLIDFYHLELAGGPKHQRVPFLRLTIPLNGLLDLYDMSKSVLDHLVKAGIYTKETVQPAGTKEAAVEKKTEKKPEKKSAPAKKSEAKPAAKPAPAPAKKAAPASAKKPAAKAKKSAK